MWPFHRHKDVPAPSPPTPGKAVISAEAAQALAKAGAAQRAAKANAEALRPLLSSIHQHLADNEIAATVAANYARRPRTS